MGWLVRGKGGSWLGDSGQRIAWNVSRIAYCEALNNLVLSTVEWMQTSNDKTGSYEQALYMQLVCRIAQN